MRGDRVLLEGALRVPDDPGFAEALAAQGHRRPVQLDAFERLGRRLEPVRARDAGVPGVRRALHHRLFPPREAGLLLGLVLGDDSQLDPGLARDFHATGSATCSWCPARTSRWSWRRCWRSRRGWVSRDGRGSCSAAARVAFFVVLTGAEPSVMRAGVMAALALVGVLMGRPAPTASILAGAVLRLLVLDLAGLVDRVPALAWRRPPGWWRWRTPLAAAAGHGSLPKPVALAAGTIDGRAARRDPDPALPFPRGARA